MKRFWAFYICSMILCSCYNTDNDSRQFKDRIVVTDRVDDLTQYISNVEVSLIDSSIVLSTISKALIGKNGVLYVLNAGGSFVSLTKDGKIGVNYSNRGRAANEYMSPIDICLSDHYFSILDVNKILSFKIGDPNEYRSISFPEGASPYDAFAPSGDEGFFLFSAFSNSPRNDHKGVGNLLYLIDDKSNIVQEYIPRNDCTFSLFNISQSRGNTYYLRPQDSEFIFYELGDGAVEASYKIDFGDKSIPPRYFYDKAGEDIGMYMLSEFNKLPMEFHDTKDYAYCRYCGPGAQEFSLVFNKQTKKCITWMNKNTDTDFRILCSDDDFFYLIPTANDEVHGPLASIINKEIKAHGCEDDQSAIVKIEFIF